MAADAFCRSRAARLVMKGARAAITGVVLSILGSGVTSAYIGRSYLRIPGIAGTQAEGTPVQHYRSWLAIDAAYWKSNEGGIFSARNYRRSRSYFSGPPAPRKGPSTLVISIDKRNPTLPQLMERCASAKTMPELTYAESSVMARGLSDLGPRPEDIPEYFEYRLKDVQFSDCPVVEGAPEQAIVLSFGDIEWINYHEESDGKALTLEPAAISPVGNSPTTRSFVLSWIALAHDASPDQCSKPSEKPSDEDYYALIDPAEAARERAQPGGKGGPDFMNGQMEHRGPHKLNACLLPGIVRDPGLVMPQSKIALGLDLDGNDGTGTAPAGIRKHRNYVADDGRTGIDNQLYTVEGCMPGFQGHKGFLMQYTNEQRRNGLLSILVQISGIDDEQNDGSVDVTVLYSKDPMAKSASGTQVLPDATFRLTDNPEYAHYATRLHGRMVNGVIVTDPIRQFQMHLGIDGEVTLFDAAMRLRIMPDGMLSGVLGGYQDWRKIMQLNANSVAELHYGFQCPAMYNAFKRNADGLRDPVTGEYNGVSSAYELEGTPAFVLPAPGATTVTQADTHTQGYTHGSGAP